MEQKIFGFQELAGWNFKTSQSWKVSPVVMNYSQVWHKCTPGRQHGDDGCKLFFLWSVNSHLSITEKECGALVVMASMFIHGIYMTQIKMGEEGGEEHVDQTAALQRED